MVLATFSVAIISDGISLHVLTSFNTVAGVPGGRVSVGLLSSLALSVVR